ncbi:hypothetical protein EfmAA610_15460 [Enterococcus faecium]|nr:hypothetical protein EfmAA610_15460 [Enterococcus faecium]
MEAKKQPISHGNDNENIDTYTEFTKDIDTVLAGYNPITLSHFVTEMEQRQNFQLELPFKK